ncbi:MAG: formate dehydrogenase [Deltaproteobacteria bacterium HGW-Deltaproteobacteria-1]|jgi:hypothetical protein|nr:MAG: formate dehydrogenase [Deltaproteobacteria bacterium HGW-Deltaproteobacteria-1]
MEIKVSGGRRAFIKGAAIFCGSLALMGIVKPAPVKPEEPLPQSSESKGGYRLTEHIKKYYETAKL